MTTPPPTTPGGAPPPPAQTAALEAATLQSVVDALKPMFNAQAPNINTWETRCLVERMLHEKESHGPLQGADVTAKALFEMAVKGWDDPTVKSGMYLRAACVILNVSPVPAATQPPAQDATTPTWGNFPAALPGAAETATTVTTPTDKAARKAAKKVRKAAKRARQRALLSGITAAIAAVAAVIAAIASGWAAFIAAAVAVAAGATGAVIGVKTFRQS